MRESAPENAGQVMIGFVVFISFAVPLFIGGIICMESSLRDMDLYNRLDIVSISGTRIKAGFYNQIASNNRRIISLEAFDPRKYLGPARDELMEMIIDKNKNVLGSAGKA